MQWCPDRRPTAKAALAHTGLKPGTIEADSSSEDEGSEGEGESRDAFVEAETRDSFSLLERQFVNLP